MVAPDDRESRGRPRHRVVTAAAVLLAVLGLGVAVRQPAAPAGLEVSVRPRPPPVPGSTLVRALDPVYLTDLPGAALELPAGARLVAGDDGRLVAVAGPGATVVAEARTLQRVATLPGLEVEPRFTPEGDGLVVAGPGGIGLQPLDGPPFPPVPVAGALLDAVGLGGGRAAVFAAEERAGRALVVDLVTGAVLADVRLPALRSERPALGWDVQRRRLYVADRNHLRVVDLAAGAMVAERDLAAEPAQALVAPDGARLHLTGPGGAWLLDTAALTVLGHAAEPVERAVLSPDGRWLALDGPPRGVRVLDAATLTPVADLGGAARAVVGFAPHSDLLYTTGPGPGPDGSVLLAIEVATRRVVGTRTLLDAGTWSPAAGVLAEQVRTGAPR